MKMIMDMRTQYAYCSNPISISPHMTPGSSLSKYKREIVMTLCNYISHQTKPPPRDLNTLLTAAANYAMDSQIAAIVTLEQPSSDIVQLKGHNDQQPTPLHPVEEGEQTARTAEAMPHCIQQKLEESSSTSLQDSTLNGTTEPNILKSFSNPSGKSHDLVIARHSKPMPHYSGRIGEYNMISFEALDSVEIVD